MASYTKLTLSGLRDLARYKLADTTARWWSDAQLALYIDDWQKTINRELNCLHGTATFTTTTQFTTQTSIATDINSIQCIRRAADTVEIPHLTVYRLNELDRSFRWISGPTPGAWYVEEGKIGIFPTPSGTATLIAEYITEPVLTGSTDAMTVPAWTKYSVIPYVCYRAYSALGPNFDHNKALKYKNRFEWWMSKFRAVSNKWFAVRPLSLKVDTGLAQRLRTYDREIKGSGSITMPGILSNAPTVETPTGDINGVNDTFTLASAPEAILLIVNNATLVSGTHYTLSGSTITMNADYIPQTGWDITAYYWV